MPSSPLLPTIGKQHNPGEAVTRADAREIRKLCETLASTTCSFEVPNHGIEEHKAIEDRIFHILNASAHDAINEIAADLVKLAEREYLSDAERAEWLRRMAA